MEEGTEEENRKKEEKREEEEEDKNANTISIRQQDEG